MHGAPGPGCKLAPGSRESLPKGGDLDPPTTPPPGGPGPSKNKIQNVIKHWWFALNFFKKQKNKKGARAGAGTGALDVPQRFLLACSKDSPCKLLSRGCDFETNSHPI